MPDTLPPPAAPPTPSPSPAPAPAPTPTPAPEPSPASPSGTSDPAQAQKDRDDVFATLDAKLRLPEPAPKPDAAKPEPSKPAAPPKEKTVPEFKMPKEFRENYERVKGEAATLKTQLSELQTKIADYEKKGKDSEALRGLMDAKEKELSEAKAQLRSLRFEASDEYKQKYEAPFENAAQFARLQVEQLQAIVKPADEENAAVTRNATWDDFRALYQMPIGKGVTEAKKLFGDNSGVVIGHLTSLQKMDYEREKALSLERKNHEARAKEEEGKQVKLREDFDATFKRVGEELAESVEGYKDADPTDKELAALRTEGYQIFDAQPANQQQLIVKGAHIRHRVAAYGPNMLTIQRLKKQVSELEAKVQELTPKPPGETRHPGGDNNAPPMEDWAEGLRKVVNAAPAM